MAWRQLGWIKLHNGAHIASTEAPMHWCMWLPPGWIKLQSVPRDSGPRSCRHDGHHRGRQLPRHLAVQRCAQGSGHAARGLTHHGQPGAPRVHGL